MLTIALDGEMINEDSLLKLFEAASSNVAHTNKEIRDTAINMIKEIYKLCNDDATTFTKNLK